MRKVVYKIIALFMVTILMVSTTSFSLYKHFCGDSLVEISRYVQTDECCDVEISHKPISELNFSEKDCCKSETETNDILTFESSKSLKIVKNQLVFITAFYYSFIQPIEENITKTNYYNNFSPPKIVYNKQIQFQSFLI